MSLQKVDEYLTNNVYSYLKIKSPEDAASSTTMMVLRLFVPVAVFILLISLIALLVVGWQSINGNAYDTWPLQMYSVSTVVVIIMYVGLRTYKYMSCKSNIVLDQ
jgi:membrane protein YdbS with pleckstrin-like domain